MTLSIPPRSLPPPVLPPKVVAQTRIKALEADLAADGLPVQQAALAYEIGALTELRLRDPIAATQRYEAARGFAPGFRPPLFALARGLRERGDYAGLVRVLESLLAASPAGAQRAAVLVELSCVLTDQLGDARAGALRLQEALEQDPGAQAALLFSETQLRAQGDKQALATRLGQRADAVTDPTLRSLLLCESAALLAAGDKVDAAMEQLAKAAALPVRRAHALRRLFMLAREHGRANVAASAANDLAGVLQQSVASPGALESTELVAEEPEAAERTRLAGFYYRQAGRMLLQVPDARAAAHAYTQATACLPDEPLLHLEHLAACELADDPDGAQAQVQALLVDADPRRASALHFQLAELSERKGERAQARASLQAALAADPDSPAVLAVLEDALLDDHAFDQLYDHLQARAARSTGGERQMALARAAGLAADHSADGQRALRLHQQLLDEGADPTPWLREAYGAALRVGDAAAQARAAGLLLARATSDAERSALMRGQYLALLADQKPQAAKEALLAALQDPTCESWAGYALRVVSALHQDFPSLARAHAALAEAAQDLELSAAHACAQARALLRAGDRSAAAERLRAVLELAPANAYAVALLEEILLAQGETEQAVALLREAAAAEHNARARELSLLHAGAAAEAAGQVELAARSYEEAIERDGTALAPLWALRRLGERSGADQVLLSALEGLALREDAAGQAGVANLELGERYDTIGKPELAIAPLEAVLEGGSLGFEAAVALALLPRNAFDAELRPRALAVLAQAVSREARADIEREQIAESMLSTPEQARQALSVLQANQSPTHGDAVVQLLSCQDENDRAQALAALSRLSNDVEARAQLHLHAVRAASFGRGAAAADALVSALGLIEQAPECLPAALALDEALSVADDPEAFVQALRARLPHATAQTRQSLQAALARVLQAAGHAAEAADWARLVLQNDPSDVSVWETLRVAARATSDFETVVLACDTLAYHADGEARAVLLEEAAAVLEEELGRPADAEVRLHAALEADESRNSLFERLHDLLLERRDLEGLSSLISARVRVAGSEDERTDLLYEQARVLRALGEREATLACLDEVLASVPGHMGALGLSAETHASQKDWHGAVSALRALASADGPASQQRLARQGAADFLERNLQDPAGAYRELLQLAQRGLADFAIWKRMAQLAEHAGLHGEAAAAWTEAAQLTSAESAAGCERAAGDLLEQRVGDKPAAVAAYRRALGALDTDIDAFERLTALVDWEAERAWLVQRFLGTLFSAIGRAPADEGLLRSLVRAAVVAQDKTLDHAALEALSVLGMATLAEQSELDVLTRALSHTPNRALDEADFKQLGASDPQSAATSFARIVCKAWLDATDDSPTRHGVDRRGRIKRHSDHPVRTTLGAFCRAFGLSVSDFYVGGGDPRALTMIMVKGHLQPWVAGSQVPAEFGPALRFRVGEQAAAMRAQLLPLSVLGKAEARDLLLSGVLAAAPEATLPDAERLRPAAEQLAKHLSRGERRELQQHLAALKDPTAQLQRVAAEARLGAQRAGLLACGSLRTALSNLVGERLDAATITADPAAVSLLRFWCSNACVSLRRKLGLGL
ncbi:MAG TPA: tetratricopeptide repeat protein [Polyangiales bacterium]